MNNATEQSNTSHMPSLESLAQGIQKAAEQLDRYWGWEKTYQHRLATRTVYGHRMTSEQREMTKDNLEDARYSVDDAIRKIRDFSEKLGQLIAWQSAGIEW